MVGLIVFVGSGMLVGSSVGISVAVGSSMEVLVGPTVGTTSVAVDGALVFVGLGSGGRPVSVGLGVRV